MKFIVIMNVFLSCDKTLWTFFQVLSIQYSCNKCRSIVSNYIAESIHCGMSLEHKQPHQMLLVMMGAADVW